MATKPGTVVKYNKELLSIKSHVPLSLSLISGFDIP